MTKRTFIDKNGNSWEWEETPELVKYLNTMHQTNVGTTQGGRQETPQKIKES